jgi:hypothetical protein
MNEYVQKVELLQNRIKRELHDFMKQGHELSGKISISTEDAVSVIFYLDILRANLIKIEEVMK